MGRLNWNQRQSPTDMDDTAPTKPSLEFDISSPFPERVNGKRIGPSMITNALKSGLYVLCCIHDIPGIWAVDGARWSNPGEGAGRKLLEVHTINGYRVAQRIWTPKTLKGIKL